MKFAKVRWALEKAFLAVKAHSGTICAVAAIGGVLATAYFSGKAAVRLDHEIDPDTPLGLRLRTTARICWKPIASILITSGLIWKCDRIHVGQKLGLAGALAVANERNARLDRKLIEEVGEERAREIRHDIYEEEMKDSPIPKELLSSPLAPNEMIVWEPYTHQYIRTTKERIGWALLEMNERYVKDLEVSLSTFIKLIGGIPDRLSDKLRWSNFNTIQEEEMTPFGGQWIRLLDDMQIHQHDDPNDIPCLFFEVDPREQRYEEMSYNQECP